ncbi:MAG: hypothetical protein AB8B63_24310 [Granulosicoccus sp.]
MRNIPESQSPSSDKADEMAETATDGITITDRSARRRFIRLGSTFLLGSAAAGASLTASAQALAADCDRSAEGKTPEHAGNGSDGDAGAGADPIGCGRRYTDKPKISKAPQTFTHEVGKLKG